MPRRGAAPKRELIADPVYNSRLVTQFTNQVLKSGKKNLAETIIYKSFDIVAEKTGSEPLSVVRKAVENVKPAIRVKPRRVGGATYQVPVEVPAKLGTTLAIRWLTEFAQKRKGKSMAERLASEIMDAASGTGSAIKRKEDTHKMAEANRAFAHYKW